MQRVEIAVTFSLEGAPVESMTHLLRSGPYVLVLHTTLPQRGLAVELHSAFVGHSSVRTHATHLLLGPVGQPAQVLRRDDASSIVDPVNQPDSCVYAHCHELIALLRERGVALTVGELPTRPVPLAR